MTDEEALERASVSPPEITKAFSMLSSYGLPRGVLSVDEAADMLVRLRGMN